MDLVQTWHDNTLRFDTSLSYLDLDSRSQVCKKATFSAAIFSFDLDGSRCTVETCWRDEPRTHFIPSIQYSRERALLTWFC